MYGSLSGQRAFDFRLPVAGSHPVREEDADEAALRLPGDGLRQRGAGGNHRIEQREGQRHAGALEERPPRNVPLRDERHDSVDSPGLDVRPRSRRGWSRGLLVTVFIWNGRLLTTPSTMAEKRPLLAITSRAICADERHVAVLDAAAERVGQQLLRRHRDELVGVVLRQPVAQLHRAVRPSCCRRAVSPC